MEDGRRIRWQMPFLPQYVGARQRGVAAEVDLDRGREPAEVESPVSRRTRKAVSDKFISRAILCIHTASAGAGKTHTAAGLPPNASLVNASTWVMVNATSVPLISGWVGSRGWPAIGVGTSSSF